MKKITFIFALLLLTTMAFAGPIESMLTKINGDTELQPLSLEAGPLAFQREASETTIDLANAPFKKALLSSSSDLVTMTPVEGLTVSFNQKRQTQQNLMATTLSMVQEDNFNLGYTTGKSSFKMQQNVTTSFDPKAWDYNGDLNFQQKLTTRVFGFSQGIGDGNVELGRSVSTLSRPKTIDDVFQTDSLKINMPFNVAGITPKVTYLRDKTTHNDTTVGSNEQFTIVAPFKDNGVVTGNIARKLENGQKINTNEYSVALPFVVGGNAQRFSFQNSKTSTNNIITNRNQLLQMDLALFNQQANFQRGFSQRIENGQQVKSDLMHLLLPLSIGSFNPTLTLRDDQTLTGNVITGRDKIEQIIMPMFGQEAKYLNASTLTMDQGNSIGTEIKEIVVPLGKLIPQTAYIYADRKGYTNSVLTSRDMRENINLPLDRLLKGMSISYDRSIALVAGKPQVDLTTKQLVVPLRFVSENAAYQMLLQSRTEGNNATVDTQQHTFKMPFNGINATYVSTSARVSNEDWKTVNNLTLAYPIIFGLPVDAVYSYITNENTGKTDSRFSFNFGMPVKLLGREIMNGNSFSYSTLGQDKVISNLSIPFGFGPVSIVRVAVDEPQAPDNTTYTIETPRINMSSRMSVKGDGLFYQQDNQPTMKKRNLNVVWQPAKRLKTTINLGNNDLVPAEKRSLAVDTSYVMGTKTNINFQYAKKEQLNILDDKTQMAISIQHLASREGGLSFKTTMFDLNGAGQDFEPFSNTEMSFGSGKFQIIANMLDYDTQKLIPLEDTSFSFEARHISEKRGFTLKYQNDAARYAALLAINSSFNIGPNTKIRVSMTDNGLDPMDVNRVIVRNGRVWDFNINHQASDNLNIQADMRTYRNDNWYNIGIAGGLPTGYGQISLSYQNGEFVPRGQTVIPESMLTLKYDKTWEETGDLAISLSREVNEKANTEARAEFGFRF